MVTWQEKVLKKEALQAALRAVGIKFALRDTSETMQMKIIQQWPTTSQESERAQSSASSVDERGSASSAITGGLGQATNLGKRGLGEGDAASTATSVAGNTATALGKRRADEAEMGSESEVKTSQRRTDDGAVKDAATSSSSSMHAEASGDAVTSHEGAATTDRIHRAADASESRGSEAHVDRTLPLDGSQPDGNHEDLMRGSIEAAAATRADPAASGGAVSGSFGTPHLAHVLNEAFATKAALTELVQLLKGKHNAFKNVQLSSRSEGRYDTLKIAEQIARCRPDPVADTAGLFTWLVKVRCCGVRAA